MSWIRDAVSYVGGYDKPNLLTDPTGENQSAEEPIIAQEQAAGFQSNPLIRRKIEEYAMKRAHAVLLAKGYKNIRDTSKTKPYDYICERNGTSFFVEVKGTQTAGSTVILTKGEVENVQRYPQRSILVLVRSVGISPSKPLRVTRGVVEMKEKWTPRSEDLQPLSYVWTVK